MTIDLDKRPSRSPTQSKAKGNKVYPELTGGFIEVSSATDGGAYKDIIEGQIIPA